MSKVALITGSSSGLGLDIAKHFLDKGWKVIGLSRRAAEINSDNYVQKLVDIKDAKAVEKTFSELKDEKIDLLVNNAAIFTMTEFEKTDLETIDNILDVNLKGAIYTTKYAIDLMNQDSRIVFINSVAGLEELMLQSIYCASKHGLTAFAGVIAQELRPKGIKVASIHPGGINTPLWNDDNPYPCGRADQAIPPAEISKLIDHIVESPANIDFKTIKLFPDTEWHH